MTPHDIERQAICPTDPSLGNDRCFWCEELLLEGDVVTVAKRSGAIDSCTACAIGMGTVLLARGYCRKNNTMFTPSGLDIL